MLLLSVDKKLNVFLKRAKDKIDFFRSSIWGDVINVKGELKKVTRANISCIV